MSKQASTVTARNDDPLMEIQDLEFSYSKRNTLIDGINFQVHPGEIIGISGENGSGKSTLLKLLVGLLKPKRGNIEFNGRVGYSPQNLLLFDNLTTMENFRVFGTGMKLSEAEINAQSREIMKRLNFEKYADTMIKNLSGGTKQKINFGISLLGDPQILILDEPYQGMDYSSFKSFWDIQFDLRQAGKSIVIVSHMIEDQSKFTRSLHLIRGRLQSCTKLECPMGCRE